MMYPEPVGDKEIKAQHEAMEKRLSELAKKAPKNPVAREIGMGKKMKEEKMERRERWNSLHPIFSEASDQFVNGKISWEEALGSVIELLDLERDRS